MQYYVAKPGNTHPENYQNVFIRENNIRIMSSAAYFGKTCPCHKYALDNGAFTDHLHNLPFNHERFKIVLDKCRVADHQPDFVILPDRFDSGIESLKYSREYYYLHDEFKLYLPIHEGVQVDELTNHDLDIIDGIFFGGSNQYRNRNIVRWTDYCHDIGLKVHVGRVGTKEMFSFCYMNNVDSCDSSTLVRNRKLHKYLEFIDTIKSAEYMKGVIKQ